MVVIDTNAMSLLLRCANILLGCVCAGFTL
nr:MAG TPA: putative ribonuclease [Caudoviricetes sp.]